MSYIVCALAFGLYYLAHKKMPSKLKSMKGVSFVPFALLAIATMTLADTAVGGWVATITEWVLSLPASLIGVSSAIVAAVVFALLTIAALFDLIDLKPEGIAKTAVIVLPFLALVATGPLAEGGAGLFESVSQTGSEAMRMIVGL